MFFILFNFIGFQLVWAACAYGSINHAPLLGVISGFIYILIHFSFTPTRLLDAKVMLAVATSGIILDTLNLHFSLISFISGNDMLPYWLITLWLSFSLILPHSLYWLSRYPLLAVILGGIGGSGSYFIGHQLGAISLSVPLYPSLIAYSIQWAILVPAAFWLITYLKNANGQR
jgi:hypothetical protein